VTTIGKSFWKLSGLLGMSGHPHQVCPHKYLGKGKGSLVFGLRCLVYVKFKERQHLFVDELLYFANVGKIQ
jgi:hypothetical protein